MPNAIDELTDRIQAGIGELKDDVNERLEQVEDRYQELAKRFPPWAIFGFGLGTGLVIAAIISTL